MRGADRPIFRPLRDESGVALPLALFGLVAVSLLVSTALMSSSTELAISSAHQDATRALYAAEEGVQRYLAGVDATLAAGGGVQACNDCEVTLADGSSAYVNVVRLDSVGRSNGNPPFEIYCLTARGKRRGGREVGALFRVNITPSDTLALNIQAAASFGEDVRMHGDASLSGRQADATKCADGEQVKALQYSQDATLTTNGASIDTVGGTERTNETKWEMQARLLNHLNPSQLSANATIRFSPSNPFNGNYNGGKSPHSDNPLTTPYNWGCPGTMVSCNPGLYPNQDTTYYPVVDIDAGGGEIKLNGNAHGQGILIIRNGTLKITGTFDYKGVVIVEGAVDVAGSAKIDGAIVGLGTVTIGNTSDDESALGGSMEITYDPCAITQAQDSFNRNAGGLVGARSLAGGSFGWFEIVR